MKTATTLSMALFLETLARSSAFVLPRSTFQGASSSLGVVPSRLKNNTRTVHLPPTSSRRAMTEGDSSEGERQGQSVTGPIYGDESDGSPRIKLFTKEGCTLCDKVKDVLESVRESHPHSLYAMDITDDDKQEWFSKYKYDIPVLHMNDNYWTKHRLVEEDAIAAIEEAKNGEFAVRSGEPDAARLERS